MHIWVPHPQTDGETRAILTPQAVGKLVKDEHRISVASGLGTGSFADDAAYTDAGATVVPGEQADNAWGEADTVLVLTPPRPDQVARMREGSVLIGLLDPFGQRELVTALRDRRVTSFAMELIPRISRAQAMDVLSSQANIGGYMAVILGASHCPKLFPMLMTAAGTIAPSRVFVIGAGVAGLQAIATARRLGAIVEAIDVRAATKEQVQSLGARFVELPGSKQDDKSAGGYAREQTDEEKKQQQELQAKHVMNADVVIATAAIPGKAPPLLIPRDVVEGMRPGSVIVDLAASMTHGRGNCELTKPGQRHRTEHGVMLIGETNLPALAPVHASQMLAANMLALLKELVRGGTVAVDVEDDIQRGACVTHGGQVMQERLRQAHQLDG